MNTSIISKLEGLAERFVEIGALLSSPEILADQNQFRELSKEYAQLTPIVKCFEQYQRAGDDLVAAEEMRKDPDLELREMAEEEIDICKQSQKTLSLELQKLLLPVDPNDQRNVFLEIRAGTGGDEAAIFAGNLFRMYSYYAEQHRWPLEILSENSGEHGGYKSIIVRIQGEGAYSKLKFESGAHRVQRVPETETQGRVHTSAATVVVMPEIEAQDAPDINPADLRIDTYRASGAGGQHINKTDSAVRITHLPTGIVVECQDERSQHKNRARAMSLLASRMETIEREKRESEEAQTRRQLVGSGDRSDRIRTYNYPQGRITDHRINLTLYKLDEVLQGKVDLIIEPLISEDQADRLTELQQS